MMRILIILILIPIFSCQIKPSAGNKTIKKHGWEMLKISVDNKTIWVPVDQDTCYFWERFDDSLFAKFHDGDLRVESKKFLISKQFRDSLFKLAENAIKNHQETEGYVTDYAGQYVTLTLEQYNSSISCKYSSISDWTKISPTLGKISTMTFDKVPKVK